VCWSSRVVVVSSIGVSEATFSREAAVGELNPGAVERPTLRAAARQR
jgi:hypothetical protein